MVTNRVNRDPEVEKKPARHGREESADSASDYESYSNSNSNSPHDDDGDKKGERREKEDEQKGGRLAKEAELAADFDGASSPSLGRRDDGFREKGKRREKKDRDDGDRGHRRESNSKHASKHGAVNRNREREKDMADENKQKAKQEDPAKKSKEREKPQPDWVKCHVCNKSVKGQEGLKMHMKTSARCGAYRGESTRDPCPLCGKMISKGEWPLEQHLENGCAVAEKQRQKNAKARLKSRSRSPLKRKAIVGAADVVEVAASLQPTRFDGSKRPPEPLGPPPGHVQGKSTDLALTPWRRQSRGVSNINLQVRAAGDQNNPGFDSGEWLGDSAGGGGSGGSFSFRPSSSWQSSSSSAPASSSNANAPLVALFHGLAGLLDR